MGLGGLALEIENLWNRNKVEIENKLNGWLIACKDGDGNIRNVRKQFHQWVPLKVYVSVGKAKSNTSIFSVRFFGQEVAELIVQDRDEVKLRLKRSHIAQNKNYFEIPTEQGDYPWNSKSAKEFRKYFKKLAANTNGMPEVNSDEHRIESKFIEEMLCVDRSKFGGYGLRIQPITIGDCPLQFPVPFSANTGKPKYGRGYIDILARRKGKDNKVRLSIWELKKPGEYKAAASQAYIYAVTMLKILRYDKRWYKLFGFNSIVPKSIEIEAIVAITSDQQKRFDVERTKIENESAFEINGDLIKLYSAYYTEKPCTIILDGGSLIEN